MSKMNLIKYPEKQFEGIEDLYNYLNSQQYTDIECTMQDLKIKDDGGLIITGYDEMPLSEDVFHKILDMFNIPSQYILKTCPADLAAYNINRFFSKSRDNKVKIWTIKDNGQPVVRGITSPEFTPIRNAAVAKALLSGGYQWKTNDIFLTSSGLRITNLFERECEPKPGDIFKVGFELVNYDVFDEYSFLSAGYFMYRLICKNGAKVRYPAKKYLFEASRPLVDLEIQECLQRLTYTDEEINLLSSAITVIGKSIIGTKNNYIFEKMRKKFGSRIPLPKESPFNEDSSYYDVFNYITRAAQNRVNETPKRRELEAWGGSILDKVMDGLYAEKEFAEWEMTKIPLITTMA